MKVVEALSLGLIIPDELKATNFTRYTNHPTSDKPSMKI
jgi:hypothetical protein